MMMTTMTKMKTMVTTTMMRTTVMLTTTMRERTLTPVHTETPTTDLLVRTGPQSRQTGHGVSMWSTARGQTAFPATLDRRARHGQHVHTVLVKTAVGAVHLRVVAGAVVVVLSLEGLAFLHG